MPSKHSLDFGCVNSKLRHHLQLERLFALE